LRLAVRCSDYYTHPARESLYQLSIVIELKRWKFNLMNSVSCGLL